MEQLIVQLRGKWLGFTVAVLYGTPFALDLVLHVCNIAADQDLNAYFVLQ